MINGIINIKKEKGYTSHDVVAKLRGIVGQRKIGHTGTLDPDATGVLPVCLGKATKLCDLLTDKDKTYETVLLLGVETDTQDISGEVLNQSEVDVTEEEVKACVMSYVGEYDQVPPMYSALKVNGKKLYELAREGKTIERKSRKVTIHQIEILEMNLPEVRLRVSCSKGTYIRTLCHDVGQALKCFGCMKELVRTQVSRFNIEESLTLGEVQAFKDSGRLLECIKPLEEVFEDLVQVTLEPVMDFVALNGGTINAEQMMIREQWKNQEELAVYSSKSEFIGVYNYCKSNDTLKLKKMFYDREK